MNKQLLHPLLGLLIWAFATPAAASEPASPDPSAAGTVLMIRHAIAPGSGDPENFTIGDCTTQRNLDERGRAQARQIGRWLRSAGLTENPVFSSQWCRCLETARLLDAGPVTELPALNSFFQRPQDREPNLTALRNFLSRLPADGPPVIMVTHYVNIAGISGLGVSSGEGVLLRLDGKGGFTVTGRLTFGL